jgi:hypothetical protein
MSSTGRRELKFQVRPLHNNTHRNITQASMLFSAKLFLHKPAHMDDFEGVVRDHMRAMRLIHVPPASRCRLHVLP